MAKSEGVGQVLDRSGKPSRIVEIAREYTFDAAHMLEWHSGPCARLHGHTYRLVVVVEGGLSADGVVLDFADLDTVVRTEVLEVLDHRYLNEVLENPTAELIAEFAWQALGEAGLNVSELTLWETPRSWVRVRS